ncbi:hypothetical protein HPB47_000928 [Ixodes persulcatus]|uniref:Uncharacterized protein n=1 Tax=Ixodes persulcatus TaxID=34615 RepID=A0AC60PQN4_IXOPE|nr:hypothetical protein HPB47_000928 [Ixodes persulcatus]
MPVNQDELLDFLCRLSDEENLRVTVKHCAKGGLITGASAMLAALFMGPVGFAVGGAVGGCVAAVVTRDQFMTVGQIIGRMPERQKDELYMVIQRAFRDVDITDIVTLGAVLSGDLYMKKRIIATLIDYFQNRMHLF